MSPKHDQRFLSSGAGERDSGSRNWTERESGPSLVPEPESQGQHTPAHSSLTLHQSCVKQKSDNLFLFHLFHIR